MTFLDSWIYLPVMLFIALNLLYILQKLKVFIWWLLKLAIKSSNKKSKWIVHWFFKTQTETFSLNCIRYYTKTTHHAFALQYWRTHHPCYWWNWIQHVCEIVMRLTILQLSENTYAKNMDREVYRLVKFTTLPILFVFDGLIIFAQHVFTIFSSLLHHYKILSNIFLRHHLNVWMGAIILYNKQLTIKSSIISKTF